MTSDHKNISLLHIHGQDAWHDHAWIVGNRKSLTALRDAIDKALADQKNDQGQAIADVMASDGEGYEVVVQVEDGPWNGEFWKNAAMPYGREASSDNQRDGVIMPFQRDPRYHERVANGQRPVPGREPR